MKAKKTKSKFIPKAKFIRWEEYEDPEGYYYGYAKGGEGTSCDEPCGEGKGIYTFQCYSSSFGNVSFGYGRGFGDGGGDVSSTGFGDGYNQSRYTGWG